MLRQKAFEGKAGPDRADERVAKARTKAVDKIVKRCGTELTPWD